MAEPTEKQFSALIAEQKATTQAMMSVEERAAADAAVNEKNQNRIAGGIQDAKTRAANSAEKSADDDDKSQSLLENIAGGITDISSGSKGSASSEKEKKNEELAAEKKRTGLLGKIASGIAGMKDFVMKPIKGAGKGILAMLKTTLLAGALLALIAFFDSKHWKKIKKWLVEKAPGFVETLSNVIEKMTGLFTGETWTKAWEKLKEGDISGAFSEVAIGVAALAATIAAVALLLAPLGTIGLAMAAIRATGRALGPRGSTARLYPGAPLGGGKPPRGRRPVVPRVGRGPGGRFIALQSTAKKTGVGLLSGAGKIARFFGPVGIAVGAGLAIYSGITEGMEAYKKTGKLAEGFKTGAAAALKTLTFGLVSTETFKSGFDYIQKHVEQLFNLSVEVDEKEYAALIKQIKIDKKKEGDLGKRYAVVKATEARLGAQALAGVVVDQGLIDANIIEIAEISSLMLIASNKTKENIRLKLEMQRADENNALIAANKAVSDNLQAASLLKIQERKFKAAVTMHGKDTAEGINAAAKLDATRARLRIIRGKEQALRDTVVDAEAALLEEDKRLIKEAKAAGVNAPWRARLNLFTSETILAILPEWMTDPLASLKKLIKSLEEYLPSWLGGKKSPEQLKKLAEEVRARKRKENLLRDAVGEGEGKISEKQRRQITAYAKELEQFQMNTKNMKKAYGIDITTEEGKKKAFLASLQGFGGGMNLKKALERGEKITPARVEELDRLNKEFNKRALEKGSIYTHDQGLHDRLDRILLHDRLDRISPPTKNAERNNTMTESALQKSVGNQYPAGPTIIDSSQKVVNANKTGVQNFGTPLKNTNLAGVMAAV